MRYTKPNVLMTTSATVAIQTGGGQYPITGMKQSNKRDFVNGPAPHLSTTGAYEADE
jgi:hypothetical protein